MAPVHIYQLLGYGDRPGDDVVGEGEDEGAPTDGATGGHDCVGNTQLLQLPDVGDVAGRNELVDAGEGIIAAPVRQQLL